MSSWINAQSYRNLDAETCSLWICRELCETMLSVVEGDLKLRRLAAELRGFADGAGLALRGNNASGFISSSGPEFNVAVKRFSISTGRRIYVFVDDFHYLLQETQPHVLDLLHGVVRDCDAWIKVGAIKHLSRWFSPDPPTGLQLGHDADSIDLDLNLENPGRARVFLNAMLSTYCGSVGIQSPSHVFSSDATDRLVLASGGVPRDFLVLCGRSILKAKERANAQAVGKQDVTRAAGELAKAKLDELEEDAAASEGASKGLLAALAVIRSFCLNEKHWTAFRISSKQREDSPEQYRLLQGLMDARLLHLLHASVSDQHHAGERYEAYMLDLSQFSGERMKLKLHALDITDGLLSVNQTGVKKSPRKGKTSKQILAILRSAPVLDLTSL